MFLDYIDDARLNENGLDRGNPRISRIIEHNKSVSLSSTLYRLHCELPKNWLDVWIKKLFTPN